MNAEIQKILENAEDCLLTAQYNAQGGWQKAAVNRAYYCMFDCVTALLRAKEVSAKTHQGAHILFRQHFIKTGLLDVQLAENLSQVFALRQSSDYDFDFEPTDADIPIVLQHASQFFTATKSFFAIEI